ncbi:MAG: gliding motility-associated C-terminal domain-containing protein [Bacteroidales bacterium]
MAIIFGFAFIFESSSQELLVPDTIRSCYADSLLVNAGPGFNYYLWSTGDTTQVIWIKTSGLYSVYAEGDSVTDSKDFRVWILNVGIQQNDTSILCGDTLRLNGTDTLYSYFWLPDMVESDSIFIYPKDTIYYYAEIQDPDSIHLYCIDSVKVGVESLLVVDTVLQLGMGCPNENKAKIKIEVSGGNLPYYYDWPAEAIALPEDPSFAIGLTDGDKIITITDSIGCFIDHAFTIEAFPLPDLEIFRDPGDTVYIQKPYITFSYVNHTYDSTGVDTFYVESFQWDFGDSTKSTLPVATHTFPAAKTYTVLLKYFTFMGCPDTDSVTVVVKPVDLIVPSAITPNGDGSNDKFVIFEGSGSSEGGGEGSFYKADGDDVIDLNKYYISNTLIIFNRWGEKVYEVDNYNNDWDGGGLVDGTYFYYFKADGEYESKEFKGAFMIFNSNP